MLEAAPAAGHDERDRPRAGNGVRPAAHCSDAAPTPLQSRLTPCSVPTSSPFR